MVNQKLFTIVECITGVIGLIGVIFVAKAGVAELDKAPMPDETEDVDEEA